MSCMSKLGQSGDVLSPSWTMELCGSNHNNSDRISLSSHGSSGGGLMNETNFCYDTPRSVLAELRRTSSSRSHTPPGGVFCSNGSQQPCNATNYHCSPCRNNNAGGRNATISNSCGCKSHGGPVGSSPIYYNGVAEQKAHGSGTKTPNNLHNGAPNPYENYDYPRCIVQPPMVSSGSNNSGSCCENNVPSSTHSGGSGSIDWAKVRFRSCCLIYLMEYCSRLF